MENRYLNFLDKYKDKLGNTKGITTQEIQDIETYFNIKLPQAYIEYLSCFGKESGNLLSSYYTEYSVLKENREDAIYALNFDDRIPIINKPIIKDSYFFFAQWQGGVFFFFDCNAISDNPPIYILENIKIYKYIDSFSNFIHDEGLKPILDSGI